MGRERPPPPSPIPQPGPAAGGAYLCFMEFPKSRRGICGDQRGTDSVSAGRDRTTSAGNDSESWDWSLLGRGAKDVHKKWDFPGKNWVISPWNASLSSLPGLCGSVGTGVSCPRYHHPVWTRKGRGYIHPCAGRVGSQNFWNHITMSKQEKEDKAGTASSSVYNKISTA